MAGFYRITRVRPNGTETVLRELAYTDLTDEQQRRADMLADAAARKQGGVHVRVYSSDENGVVTPDDLIYDSQVNT